MGVKMADEDVKGTGWITYSGILLIIAGVSALLDSIWAFRYNDTLTDLVFFEDDLEVWGVIWLVVAVALVAAGFGVFRGETWAKWTGIGAASVAIWSNLSWAQVQPTQALIGVLLASLVIYGLAAYGDKGIA
jgi:hypothetical protein